MNIETCDSELINAAETLIQKNIRKPYTNSRLAAEMNIDQRKLERLFKRYHNMGVCAYQLQVRMNKSKEMLQEGDKKITDIARAVGYKHLCNFTRRFSDFFGISPSGFEKQTA